MCVERASQTGATFFTRATALLGGINCTLIVLLVAAWRGDCGFVAAVLASALLLRIIAWISLWMVLVARTKAGPTEVSLRGFLEVARRRSARVFWVVYFAPVILLVPVNHVILSAPVEGEDVYPRACLAFVGLSIGIIGAMFAGDAVTELLLGRYYRRRFRGVLETTSPPP